MIKLALLGEAYGEMEDRLEEPFVGPTGAELLRQLAQAGIIELGFADHDYIRRFYQTNDPTLISAVWRLHPEIHRTNVFMQRPPQNNLAFFCGPREGSVRGYPSLLKGKYVRSEFQHELDRLKSELNNLRPNLVVALGNTASWALLGKTNISKTRGTTARSDHTVSGIKVLPTYHPAAIFRQWDLRPVIIADLQKARREQEFPDVRRPARRIHTEPASSRELYSFYETHIRPCHLLAVDIETVGIQITCIGFAPSKEIALVVPFFDNRRTGRSYWHTLHDEVKAWEFVRFVCGCEVPKVFHNGLYDIPFLWRSYGIKTMNAEHDSMLLSHALQPESLKSLGFLGSIFTDSGPWKQERRIGTIKRDD